LSWIRSNAADYRENFKERLGSYSTAELGEMLSELTQSKKDLSEILENYPQRELKSKTFE
jgi:hypothetical protein